MIAPPSPYAGRPPDRWRAITRRPLAKHPLRPEVILDLATTAWGKVWDTTVGSGATAVRLAGLSVPATVVGYFFEVLLARELEARFPGVWRGNRSKEEKDLVYLPDPGLSVEIKTSGQLGYRVYGNRSYGQDVRNEDQAKKEKSGFYITVNFYRQTLTLLRFGWIDAGDWQPQASPTGQMAGLPDSVYEHKLVPIPGEYRLNGPVELLHGVGPKTAEAFHRLGIHTIRQLVNRSGLLPPRLAGFREAAAREYGPGR